MHTGAGHDQITDAGESGEGLFIAAHCLAESAYFAESSCHERSLAVVAQSQSVHDTRRKRNDVLDGAAQLNADNIPVGVNAQLRCGKGLLQHESGFSVSGSGHQSGGNKACDFLRVRRPGQHGHLVVRQSLLNAQGKPVAGLRIKALADIDQHGTLGNSDLGDLLSHACDSEGRNGGNDDVSLLHRVYVRGEFQLLRHFDARKKRVFARRNDAFDFLRKSRPHGHVVTG